MISDRLLAAALAVFVLSTPVLVSAADSPSPPKDPAVLAYPDPVPTVVTYTPTPAPTPEPTPTPAPVVLQAAAPTEEPIVLQAAAPAPIVLSTDIEHMVCSYSWDCATALRIMWAESGGRPEAWNPWDSQGRGVCGLFQVAVPLHQGVLNLFGGDCYNAATNVAAAFHLYQETLKLGERNGWCRHWFAQVGQC